ncbi:MAG: hypothetical protein GXO86_08745 [Chlorobi bacterium]|nr:hypothetical protein [Chlorobiota bacterium]
MSNRRTFIKTTVLVASGLAVSGAALAKGKGKSPTFPGIIYTRNDQGIWEGKAGSHAPEVTIKDRKVTVYTNHTMTEEHYIVRHTVVTEKGKVLGSKTFYPDKDKKAISEYKIPDNISGRLYATSFCNKHDFWLTEFEI